MTQYNYSLSADFPQGKVNYETLLRDIQRSAITTAYDGSTTIGDTISLIFKAALSPSEKTILDGDTTGPAGGLIAAHDPSPTISYSGVKVQEEEPPVGEPSTGGYFQTTGIELNAGAGESATVDLVYPYPICAFNISYTSEPDTRMDLFQLFVAPDTICGLLTAPIAIGTTTIPVSSTVTANVKKGFLLDLYCVGGSTNKLGRTISVEASTVDIETATTSAFTPIYVRVGTTILGILIAPISPLSMTSVQVSPTVFENALVGMSLNLFDGVDSESLGTISSLGSDGKTLNISSAALTRLWSPVFVRVTAEICRNFLLDGQQKVIGTGKIGGSYVRANTLIRGIYTNRSPINRKVGRTLSDCAIGSQTIIVNPIAMETLSRGDYISLESEDGLTFQEMGRITEIEEEGNCLYVTGTASSLFLASSFIRKSKKSIIAYAEYTY